MSFITALLLALAAFVGLSGFMFIWRFLLWVFRCANFSTVAHGFLYAAIGSLLLAISAWMFMGVLL